MTTTIHVLMYFRVPTPATSRVLRTTMAEVRRQISHHMEDHQTRHTEAVLWEAVMEDHHSTMAEDTEEGMEATQAAAQSIMLGTANQYQRITLSIKARDHRCRSRELVRITITAREVILDLSHHRPCNREIATAAEEEDKDKC